MIKVSHFLFDALLLKDAAKMASFMNHSYETQGKYNVAAQTELDNYACSELIESLWNKKVVSIATTQILSCYL